MNMPTLHTPLMPANAGIHLGLPWWTPACAGVSEVWWIGLNIMKVKNAKN